MQKQRKRKIKIESKVTHQDKQQQKKQEAQELLRPLPQLFDLPQLQQYFQKKKLQVPPSLIQLTKEVYENGRVKDITKDIRKGKITIKQISEDINAFIKEKQQKEVDQALLLKIKRQEMLHQLKYLESQTSTKPKLQNNPELPQDFKHPNILSKEEHENLMIKLQKEKQQRQQKQKQMLVEMQNKIKQQQRKQKEEEERRIEKAKEKRRKSIERSLEKKKQMQQKAEQERQFAKKQYEQIKKKKFLHEKIQEKYQSQIAIPALQEKKKKLRQIRQISQAFNLDNIKKHQKSYVSQRNQSLSEKSRAKDQWSYHAPGKSQRMAKFLQEQKIEQRKKLEERKRKNDEQKSRKDEYVNYMRQNFAPKVDKSKQQQLQRRIEQLHKKNEISVDKNALGMRYLQEAKRKKKDLSRVVQSEKDKSLSEDNDLLQKKLNTNYLIEKRKADYEKLRRVRIQKLVNSVDKGSNKIQSLQAQSSKLAQEYKRKQQLMKYKGNDVEIQQDAVQILLSGIKAKMGIINVYRQQQEEQQVFTTQS